MIDQGEQEVDVVFLATAPAEIPSQTDAFGALYFFSNLGDGDFGAFYFSAFGAFDAFAVAVLRYAALL